MKLTDYDALGQSALVRSGEVSALELVDASIDAIERLNPELNAVIWTDFERARERAHIVDKSAPFAGAPLLMKCLMAKVAGQPWQAGYAFAKAFDQRAEVTGNFGRRLEASGFINLGRTNIPDGAGPGTTEPLAFGATRNPWNLDYTPGGSSGGSAAAVAARLTPLAHASDGGGSIRGPASQTGLVGMKPSLGLVVEDAEDETGWYFAYNGALTRTVRDTAAFLDCVSATPQNLLQATEAPPPSALRVGLLTTDPSGALTVDAACVAAAGAVARLLEAMGHNVEIGGPADIGSSDFPPNFTTANSFGIARMLDAWSSRLARPLTEADVDPITWELAALGRTISSEAFAAALDWQVQYGERIARWWRSFDLLVTPTIAIPPQRLGTLTATPADRYNGYVRAAYLSLFCAPFNLSGNPAVSLPLGATADGLPIGVQLVGARGADALLLSVAAELERASPWSGRRPAIAA